MKKAGAAPYPFSFARRGGRVLVTNEFGAAASLSPGGFGAYAAGRPGRAAKELEAGGFLSGRLDIEGLAAGLRENLLPGWRGPHVHIIEVTRRCNSACLYCGASASPGGPDLAPRAARAVLNFIFAIPAPSLMLEFQGGEPLLNFGAVRELVLGAEARAAASGRKVNFSIVTNLSLMDEGKLRFLREHRVAVCTSLDGPAALHGSSRRLAGGSGHAAAARWLKKISALAAGGRFEAPNAICTVTRASLPHAAAVVDEFVRLGLLRVQLGPLEPLGRARAAWEKLAPSPAEFAAFYRAALGRILELNRRGVPVYEKGALQFAKQYLNRRRPRYQNLDLAYRLSYAADGSVFGSDEARLLYNGGDPVFRLGSVFRDSFEGLLRKPAARALLASDFPALAQPFCARCAFSPWCRISPAQHYAAQGSFWGNLPASPRCAAYKEIFAFLSGLCESPGTLRILRRWDRDYA